ncbi:MAG: NADH-quinone oxidoreductase subunit B family protein [Acidiferrobacter sp.]
MVEPLGAAYEAVPNPKRVVALDDYAWGCGVYSANSATVGSVSRVIPVDLAIPGCPPSPTPSATPFRH